MIQRIVARLVLQLFVFLRQSNMSILIKNVINIPGQYWFLQVCKIQ
jgi:hypothetical protein